VETGLPKLTLFWVYDGEDSKTRLSSIYSLDYPEFNVVIADGTQTLLELGTHIADDAEICVFWADDGKPVGPRFLREMVQPLTLGEKDAVSPLPDMHLWSGNALAMTCGTFYDVGNDDFIFKNSSFMKMALRFLDASNSLHGRKAQVTFSSIERLAPMCAEPVGLPS
jgi:hypothetical protein